MPSSDSSSSSEDRKRKKKKHKKEHKHKKHKKEKKSKKDKKRRRDDDDAPRRRERAQRKARRRGRLLCEGSGVPHPAARRQGPVLGRHRGRRGAEALRAIRGALERAASTRATTAARRPAAAASARATRGRSSSRHGGARVGVDAGGRSRQSAQDDPTPIRQFDKQPAVVAKPLPAAGEASPGRRRRVAGV